MRTIAALTMIMAIVVAAIPVENYGTMQAADKWDYSGENAAAGSESNKIFGTKYSNLFKTQTLTDALLQDSVDVLADSKNYGGNAIISEYGGDDRNLDISGRMYYNYAFFEVQDVKNWASQISNKKEYFEITFTQESTTTSIPAPAGGTGSAVTIPAKFSLNPSLSAKLSPTGEVAGYKTNSTCSMTYEYIKSIFVDSNFEAFEKGISDYNSKIDDFIERGKQITAEGWGDFVTEVTAFNSNPLPTNSFKIDIDDTVTFEGDKTKSFWLRFFCDRVPYTVKAGTSREIPLTNFELVERNKRGAAGTDDIYVYVAHCIDQESLVDPYDKYVDEAGYLADGFVNIVGIEADAFNRTKHNNASTVTSIKLPETIMAIGESAFEDSGLEKIEFHPDKCSLIGDRAFYKCNISQIDLTGGDGGVSMISEIGNNAFYGTKLTDITFPSSLTKLGKGCFAETPLTEVRFRPNTDKLTIDEYAFYNCPALKQVEFMRNAAGNKSIDIKKGAFSMAVDNTDGDQLEKFVFPEDMRWEGNNDYIFAGRHSLKYVTFPVKMSELIPQNTFAGCSGLAVVTLGKKSYGEDAGQNIKLSEPSLGENTTLFKDVTNNSFYVEGPAIKYGGKDSDKSKVREETLVCKAAVGNANEFYVPYMFEDKDGKTRIEQKQEGDICAEIKVTNEDNKEAELTKYSGKNAQKVEVGNDVAGYHIVSLGNGCFTDVVPTMTELIIQNGTISTIGEGALKGAEKLEKVTIGNSVLTIETDAFLDCVKLQDVYFSELVDHGMTIAPTAFKTNSDSLTFHGVIDADYAPFAYAMGENTAGFTNKKAGKNICYESLVEVPSLQSIIDNEDASTSDRDEAARNKKEIEENSTIKVIRDNANGLSTLVDYPHLENMGTYIQDALSAYMGDSSIPLDEDQARIINLALNITIPEGIQSIDTKTYFNNDKNKENRDYVDGELNRQVVPKNPDKLINLYSNSKKEGVTDGLFSGYFCENAVGGLITKITSFSNEDTIVSRDAQINLKQSEYTEIEPRGNDHLTSIVLGSTVSGMPEEYAFDSCENLTSVSLGGNVKDIGHLPFRGCTSLENVVGNGYYQCENGILYGKSNSESEESGFDKIVECLETRGRSTSRIVKVENDSKLAGVTSISEGAFSNCLFINDVDLRGTKITQIPKDCFKGASRIQEIILPETVNSVQEGAFETGRSSLDGAVDIWVYDAYCNIGEALGNDTQYTIHSYEWTDNTNTRHSPVYNFCQTHAANVEFEAIEPGWTIRFRDPRDGSIIETITGIETGASINTLPDMDAYLKEHPLIDQYEGFAFDGWLWTDSDGVQHPGREAYGDIREDRELYAQFKRADYNFTGENVTVNIVGGTLQGSGTVNADGTSIVIPSGNQIAITANESATQVFNRWSVSDNLGENWFGLDGDGVYNARTMFRVPNPPESGTITITANFINTPGGGSNTPNPDGTYTVTVNNGTGGGNYRPGATVTITANAAPTGQTFTNWTTTTAGVSLANANSASTTFTMPSSNVIVTANFSGGSGTNTPNPDGSYTVTVNNGTGGGNYQPGATVTITANAAPTGQKFTNWTATGVTLSNANSASTTFTMPSSNVTVTANYSGESSTGKHKVTVNYGSGSGEYEAGATVNITANAPESSSRVFSRWTTSNSGLGFANANAVSTSFVMPATDVTVTANYRARTSGDDDDDDDSPSRRPGTNTSTSTVTNRPGSSTNTTGTTGTVNNPTNGTSSGTTNNNNGNRIYITKNGISNTDVASLAVSGSTDNFIVRITESAEATAAVEQALTNTYGSLNGLAYLPMDISLYDATGQNKITDSTGLNITVTMPIPDVLIQYGGNARVAAADNGNLVQLTPRFTTIDGIACVSFVPPHFSPYVIYVDTNNLIAGQMLDATPATGDPIHPKWFAAIGMACVSVLLFVLSDGRKRKKYRAA